MILKYDDFKVNEMFLYIDNISLNVNESISLDIKDKWVNIFDRVKDLSDRGKKRVILYALSTLIGVSTLNNINVKNLAKETNDPVTIEVVTKTVDLFNKADNFDVSQALVDHIKSEEGLKLKAYDIKDGMITVGYGHAMKKSKSDLRVGERITMDQAEKFLEEDLKNASDAVKRLFKRWEKRGIKREITQGQFDSMVSMAYNMGIGRLLKSDFIQEVKKGDFLTAGEMIKKTAISKKYPGLEERREKESSMFLAQL